MAKQPTLEKTTDSLFDSSWKDNSPVGEQEIVSRGISVWAVAAFALAVVALLAFVHIAFVSFSVVAFLFAIFAFTSIARSGGELTGRKIASVALALALISLVGGPTRKAVYRMEFEKQAAQFCDEWFKNVKEGNVCALRQMTSVYWARPTIMSHQDEINYFANEQRGDEEVHYGMHAFLSNPTILTLWKLGDRARHSFYVTTTTWLTNTRESTERIYAITVEPDPEIPNDVKQTFFIRLVCNRQYQRTEEGEALVGWSTINSDLNPVELDKDGRPIWQQQDL